MPLRVLVRSGSCVCSGAGLPPGAGRPVWALGDFCLGACSSQPGPPAIVWDGSILQGLEGYGALSGAPWVSRVPRVGTGGNRLFFVGRVVVVTVPAVRLAPVSVTLIFSVTLYFRRTFSRTCLSPCFTWRTLSLVFFPFGIRLLTQCRWL